MPIENQGKATESIWRPSDAVEGPDNLYYLVRRGTNLRAVNKNGDAIVVAPALVEDALAVEEDFVPLKNIAPLVAISIQDYYRLFRIPELEAEYASQVEVASEEA